MSTPALIEIEDAEVFRGDTRVFEGLSLRIEQADAGEIGWGGC